MKMSSKHIAGLILGSLVALSATVAPAAAEGLSVVAPTHPTWARWLGVDNGSEFVLGRGRTRIQIGNFQVPRRMRVCVTSHQTPASLNIGARVVADGRQIVVPVAHCGEIVGARITVEPAGTLGGKRRVKGIYSIVG